MKRIALVAIFVCLPSFSFAKEPSKSKAVQDNRVVSVILLEGPVNKDSVGEVMVEMAQALINDSKGILIRINSPGGSVEAGFALSRIIEKYPLHVTCIVDGEAASMAMYILQSCHTRVMTKRSLLMAHEPSMSGGFGGYPSDWQGIADYLRELARSMAEHLVAKMACTADYMLDRIAGGKQWWFGWREASQWKAVDHVVQTVKSVEDNLNAGRPVWWLVPLVP